MREIKFRAWDTATKKMIVTGFHIFGEYTLFHGIEIYLSENPCGKTGTLERMGDVEIMQFTGLKDKNGKDIYEGDILSGIHRNQEDKEGVFAYALKDAVQYRTGGFRVFARNMQEAYFKDGDLLYQFMWVESSHHATPASYWQITEIEIIGNIYETPSLL